MKQSEKEEIFKALCCYLPFSVYIQTKGSNIPMPLYRLNLDTLPEVKPLLRPLSDITEEEKKTLLNYYAAETAFDNETDTFKVITELSLTRRNCIFYMCSRYLDVFGLIEKDLAVKAAEGLYTLDN